MIVSTPTGMTNLDGTAIRQLLGAPPATPVIPSLYNTEQVGDQLVHEIRLTSWPEHADTVQVEIQGFDPDGPELPFLTAGVLSPGDFSFSHTTALSPTFGIRFKAVNPNGSNTSQALRIEA